MQFLISTFLKDKKDLIFYPKPSLQSTINHRHKRHTYTKNTFILN